LRPHRRELPHRRRGESHRRAGDREIDAGAEAPARRRPRLPTLRSLIPSLRGPARPSPVWPDAFILCLLYLGTRLPFLHTQGFPDGDASQIALGVADAVRSGTGFQGARLYGTAFMTGYYQLL